MDDLKNQLSELIENNKIDKAIVILKEESAKRGGQLDHIIISLSSRYKRYREKSLMGLEARDQEFTKIVSDTLELVKALDNPTTILKSHEESSYSAPRKEVSYSHSSTPSSSQSNKYIQMGIGGLAVIGLIALIAVFAGGGEDSGDDSGYDETYIEPMGTAQGAYELFDISGHWRQVAPPGQENDCPGCTIDITQSGGFISISSNSGMYAELEFLDQDGFFDGALNWGNNEPDEPAQVFFDENNYLVIATSIQGSEYYMYFAE